MTEADERAERIIVERLRALAPTIPVVAEEAVGALVRCPRPASTSGSSTHLDGTKEFIGRNGEFTVNIALIERRRTCARVVLAPALVGRRPPVRRSGRPGRLARGCGRPVPDPRSCRAVLRADGAGQSLARRRRGAGALPARAQGRGTGQRRLVARAVPAGGRQADLYPRFGRRTTGRDIAAGHAVLLSPAGAPSRRCGASCCATASRGSRTRTSWPRGCRAESL
ncbi:MAG: 3'(2'),5'-bisphosphate nucleotidase CysQ [Betaproteobacteria bacterium]|nr:3'(2'),5'-bisphosphate nucleotidase CysQ [Betaproteobacteria bacterium]